MGSFRSKQHPHPQTPIRNQEFPSVNFRQSQLMNESFDINLMKNKIIRKHEDVQIFNGKKQKEEISDVMSMSGSNKRIVPMKMPQTYNIVGEFNNLAKMSLINKKQYQTQKEVLINNSYSLHLWLQQQPLTQNPIPITIDHQFPYNSSNPCFNSFILSFLKHISSFPSPLILPSHFSLISSQSQKRKRYSTRLNINGDWREVQCLSKQPNWIKLIESALHRIFLREMGFGEYGWVILRWIPMKVQISEDGGELWKKVKKEFERGRVIVGVEGKGGLWVNVMDFVWGDNKKRRYVVGRLGGQGEGMKGFLDSTPKQLLYRVNKEKGIYVLDWEILVKMKSILHLCSPPPSFPQSIPPLIFHSKSLTPLASPTLFSDQTLSLYHLPQHTLLIPPHPSPLTITLLLSMTNSSLLQPSPNYPHISLFPYDGNRVVYLKDQIKPEMESTVGDLYTGVHVFTQSQVNEYYTVVVFNSGRKQGEEWEYELGVYVEGDGKVEMYEMVIEENKEVYQIQGTFNQDNIGQNIFSPSFLNNPIYLLTVPSPTSLQLFLQVTQKPFKLTNLIVQVPSSLRLNSIRSFLSLNYTDFIKLYISSGFYYPSIAYNRVKVTEPSYYLYIPLGYQSDVITDYKIRIVTDSGVRIGAESAKWKAFQHTVSQTGLYYPDFTHKHPPWQSVFELTDGILKTNRVYSLSFPPLVSLKATFKITNLSYQNSYLLSPQSQIGDLFYSQPDLALYIIKVKKSEGRLLARVIERTEFSKCPAGLRTGEVEIGGNQGQQEGIVGWGVVVDVQYFEHEDQVEYQVSVSSNNKVEFGRVTVERKKKWVGKQ